MRVVGIEALGDELGELARVVRGRFLALREEDFVRAAELMGASPARVIGRHLIPNFMSFTAVGLMIAAYIAIDSVGTAANVTGDRSVAPWQPVRT